MIQPDSHAHLISVTASWAWTWYTMKSLKQNMKTFKEVSQSSVHATLFRKIITQTLISQPLQNSFNFKNTKWDNFKIVLLIILWYWTHDEKYIVYTKVCSWQPNRETWVNHRGRGLMP